MDGTGGTVNDLIISAYGNVERIRTGTTGTQITGDLAVTGTVSGSNLTSAGLPGVMKAWGHVDVSSPINVEPSYNVASCTSSSTGKYDVTFTNALPNANYVVSLSVQTNVSSNHYTVCYYNRTTTGFQVQKFLNGALDSGASGNFSFVIYQA